MDTLRQAWTWLRDKLRTSQWAVVGGIALVVVFILNPADIMVAIWKMGLVCVGPFFGYWADRTLFPYARPDQLITDFHSDSQWSEAEAIVFSCACLRRTLVMSSITIAIALAV